MPAATRVGFLRDKKRLQKRFLSLKLPLKNYNKFFEQCTKLTLLKFLALGFMNEVKGDFLRRYFVLIFSLKEEVLLMIRLILNRK